MRPVRIEIEGFTAFKQPACLDFSDLDLFAITGPTGAGKSSLIDAISYALYGRVPRVNNEVGVCISLGMERMHVMLEFEAAGRRLPSSSLAAVRPNTRPQSKEGPNWWRTRPARTAPR